MRCSYSPFLSKAVVVSNNVLPVLQAADNTKNSANALGELRFSHPDWLFELKYDGFRALAHIDGKRTQLVSRNGHPFASFSDLGHAIAAALPYTQRGVLDGEIVCLDRKGRPQFKDLLFRRGVPCVFAFDLLYDGKDRRRGALVDRKLELRRMIGQFSRILHLHYADHIEG